MERYSRWIGDFLSLPRSQKRLIMVSADIVALLLALWSAFALRLSEWFATQHLADAMPLFFITPVVGVALFAKLGMYRAVLRYMNVKLLQAVAYGVAFLVLSTYAVIFALDLSVPRTVPIIFGFAAWLYLGGSRIVLRVYYHWLISKAGREKVTLIYGAGSAGAQLALSLQTSGELFPVAFIDDDEKLHKSLVCGMRVYGPNKIEDLISSQGVNTVLLAMLNITPEARRRILDYLASFSVEVKTMPTLREQLDGRALDALRGVEIEDLLGRDSVAPIDSLLAVSLDKKSVCITGAGGSIGSELARQALRFGAETLVLYEQSEFALYAIESELTRTAFESGRYCQIVPILGSVTDAQRVGLVLRKYHVQTVYHAAAYKHVPIVEHNVSQGVLNNAFGTRVVALEAEKAGVERFVLISTDKAVRPTNVMGATKRLAEMLVQCIAARTESKTVFSMVRFGNVLGSSGSVVPLFRTQIEKGGPITVTHPEINRFFMTIPEAATLVIQAGSLAKGGDVFLLDMGQPVKIADLAKQMIRLSGRTVKDEQHPNGDIAIEYTGLRPGEKLYEELLIGADPEGSEHPKIMRANETFLDSETLSSGLDAISLAIENNDSQTVRDTLCSLVVDFKPSSENVDLLRKASELDPPRNIHLLKAK